MNINHNYIFNNSNLIRIINFCLLKLNLKSYYQKNADFEKLCILFYEISLIDKNVCDAEKLFYRIEKILLKKYSYYNIWKVFLVLIPLGKLCNVDIGYFMGKNSIKLCLPYNIKTEEDLYNILNFDTKRIKITENDKKIDIVSDSIVTCYLLAIELMSYDGHKDFNLSYSEYIINIWTTGFGNYLEYDNKISDCIEKIGCCYKNDEIISKLFLLLRIVYDINIKDYKNEDEIFNWQKVSEEISMQIL